TALNAAQIVPVPTPTIGAMFPQSQSTMRAVSVEPADPSEDGRRSQEVVFSLPPPRRRRPWSALALVACLALAVGVFTLRHQRGRGARGAPASNPPPAAAAPAATTAVTPAPALDTRAGALDTRTAPSASGGSEAALVGSSTPSPAAAVGAAPWKRRD